MIIKLQDEDGALSNRSISHREQVGIAIKVASLRRREKLGKGERWGQCNVEYTIM